MNELVVEKQTIENLIFEIRGEQVMLDSDLAKLYECKNGTKEINQAVKNNIDKFPERYCFRLSDNEVKILQSKILTAKLNSKTRINPRVFTEQGIYMLATVLKGRKASEVTLYIMDAFMIMKKVVSNNYNNVLVNHENRILQLEDSFDKLSSKKKYIIYEGTVYDASSALIDMVCEANDEIIIVDNYASKELFDILRNIDKRITIISKNLGDALMKKYSEQYSNIKFKNSNKFHDRYIILDRRDLYISGMSLKDIGKKYSYIYKINDKEIADAIINEVCQNI